MRPCTVNIKDIKDPNVIMNMFTPEERKTAALVTTPYTGKEIAKIRGKHYRTIKAQLLRMYRKCGITKGVKRIQLAMLLTKPQESAYCEYPLYKEGLKALGLQ